MKNTSLAGAVFIAVLVASAGSALAFAGGFDLTNGGLGQAALNTQQFGLAVCNKSPQALVAAVPIVVKVNNQSITVPSVSPIASGKCAYSYVDYSQFDMKAGQTYTANVTIDPQHTAASNIDNTVNYSIVVPAAAAANNANLTANADSQLSNPILEAWNWVMGLFGGK
jgi:hypothetical protein